MLITGPPHALGYFAFHNIFGVYFNTWVLAYYCLIGPLVFFVSSLYLIQLWLLYYDMQLAQSIKNKNWRMAINPQSVSNNWYMKPRNRKLFGNNGKYFFIIASIICIIEGIIVFSIVTVDTNYKNLDNEGIHRRLYVANIVCVAFSLPQIVLLFYTLCKFKHFEYYDTFGIRISLSKILRIACVAFIFMFLYPTILRNLYPHIDFSTVLSGWELVIPIFSCIMLYYNVPYVVKMSHEYNHLKTTKNNTVDGLTCCQTKRNKISTMIHSSSNGRNSDQNKIKDEDINTSKIQMTTIISSASDWSQVRC